ncbi:MAG: sigma-54 dependent transcriptional regulator [Pseudomonadota bacterium]
MSVRFWDRVIDFGHPSRYSRLMTLHATILVVDDDPDVLTAARLLLRRHFESVLTAEHPDEIEAAMSQSPIDVFLVDMNFAIGRNTGAEGLQAMRDVLDKDPAAVVVLMTAFGDLNLAVQAMREGAADFVLKPWQNEKLVATLNVAANLRRSRAQINALSVLPPADDMVVVSRRMREVMNVVARVAPTDANVLIRGENGTGKELVAKAVHRQSSRAQQVMATVDLGAVAETLFESELFGHMKGAFTDAVTDRAGRFQAADGGTLFLDEVGNLPPPLQTKLLRALESREVLPLGSDRTVPVDVRLVSATNQPLEALVADGHFREDLLYRLNTIEIHLPPLRDRVDDIPALAEHFVSTCARKYKLSNKQVAPSAIATLKAHRWPGNVRELSHAVERAMILGDGEMLEAQDFRLRPAAGEERGTSLNLEENERRIVQTALEQASGNISQAAASLGITRSALYRRIEKFGL